jgi:ATP-dependent Clp protease ATP-binding subunit ClpC
LFERYTERGKQVVTLGLIFAQERKHTTYGTVHILVGLLQEAENVAAQVLNAQNITLDRIESEIFKRVPEGEKTGTRQIPFTERAKKLFELALREALGMGHNYIGPEHLLIALVCEGAIHKDEESDAVDAAYEILIALEMKVKTIRDDIVRALNSSKQPRRTARPSIKSPDELLVSEANVGVQVTWSGDSIRIITEANDNAKVRRHRRKDGRLVVNIQISKSTNSEE